MNRLVLVVVLYRRDLCRVSKVVLKIASHLLQEEFLLLPFSLSSSPFPLKPLYPSQHLFNLPASRKVWCWKIHLIMSPSAVQELPCSSNWKSNISAAITRSDQCSRVDPLNRCLCPKNGQKTPASEIFAGPLKMFNC